MDKSVESAVSGLFADGSVAVERETDVESNAPKRNLFDLTQDFDLLFDAVEQDWQEQALCAQTDPEAFFPEKGGSTREAKRICQACGVRDECLEYALEHDERFGIWGGLSERERRRLKKRLG
ncbi:WhiB family transcription regulator [Corynebacterium resistens DSM 45100]|uniref:Transcriptional regulator WhiB n=1 Tax=Corynebacterium resistens (strain DSM 45100 / JCM 12819 / GTC 2026 / SICGH 158) TaxID=662755 RepID=F8E1D2_CORRG|nr:WhiB family transcription regulator [Corynebacterium resistens DSM 45100]